jgi:hypothetical protein
MTKPVNLIGGCQLVLAWSAQWERSNIMISAMTAGAKTRIYLESNCDINLYLQEIEKLIINTCENGGSSTTFNFTQYGLSLKVLSHARKRVKEALQDYGYTVAVPTDDPFEIYIGW